jgi:hypothetical protein
MSHSLNEEEVKVRIVLPWLHDIGVATDELEDHELRFQSGFIGARRCVCFHASNSFTVREA